MEAKIKLIKIKEHYPFNYHHIMVERHETARIIDSKDALSVPKPNLQNPKAFYRSFYKSISRFF